MKNLLIKKIFYILALFMVSFSFAQEEIEEDFESAPEVVIDMDFNKSLYANNLGNMYMSDSPKAVLMAMIVPQSYESGKIDLAKAMEPDLKNFKAQEFVQSGLKYYSCSGIMMQDSIEVFVEVMMKKTDDNSCVMISSMYEIGVKSQYEKEAKRAIITAKVIE
jgi:hypothetical protein